MKKGLKMLALGGMLTIGLLASNSVKALSELDYNLKIYKKYVILTDEGTTRIPTSYHFDNGTNDGYNLNLTSLRNNVQNIANTYPDYATFDSNTGDFTCKYGLELNYNGTFDCILLKNNGLMEENYTSALNKNYLVKIAEVTMLNKSKKESLKNLQKYLDEATTDKERTMWSTQIQNYNDDIARMDKLNLNDVPKEKVGYNFVTTARCVAGTTSRYNSTTGAHIGDNIDLSYYYYTIIIRDLRLNSIKYSINGADDRAISNFDKNKKEYNVQLPLNTPKDATITTNSISYALTQDNERGWNYDSGITVQDANVKLTNGTGTAKVKVKFDATPFGDNGNYEKVYTVNFSIMEYQKGDVNKDGFINSIDASIVLDLFKNGGATQDNFDYGDMNYDNILNSTDAAMILDVFKNS